MKIPFFSEFVDIAQQAEQQNDCRDAKKNTDPVTEKCKGKCKEGKKQQQKTDHVCFACIIPLQSDYIVVVHSGSLRDEGSGLAAMSILQSLHKIRAPTLAS